MKWKGDDEMNAEEILSVEIQELLNNTPVLTDETIRAVAEANRALNRDPEHIAGIIKSVFVNDILCAMEEQGINKNQLAVKWGKSRQHVSQILDKEKSKNFTLDTIVSLSMTLGLVPQRIELKKLDAEPARMSLSRPALKVAESPGEPYRTKPAKPAELKKARKQLERRK